MSTNIYLSGPMGSGVRPKKYFGATKELIRMKVFKSTVTSKSEDNNITSVKKHS
ncbi:MAG: hypothetical protein WAT79_04265 [Saprospiraceae bacterium]